MLPRTDMAGTRPLAPIEALAPAAALGDARQDTLSRLSHIAIGRQLQAEVLARLNDGTFLVRIDGTAARMNLPDGAQVGDMLDLTLVASTPRPTFLLGRPPGAAPASLSATGRLIDSLLHSAQQKGGVNSLVGSTPLVASSAAAPAQIAAALQTTLAFSGLFYESHVNQWASGGRTLADLMQEPQAQTARQQLTNNALEKGMASAGLAAPIGAAHEALDGGRALINPMRDPTAQPGQIMPATADGTMQPVALSTDAAHMINLQLDVLEQQRVLWQGELWPGQRLEWEVSEQTPKNDTGLVEPAWQSVVRFELPTLGPVSATIRLTGGHVQMQVRTATETAACSLRTHGHLLAGALEAAGSPMDLLTVKQNEPG